MIIYFLEIRRGNAVLFSGSFELNNREELESIRGDIYHTYNVNTDSTITVSENIMKV